MTLKLPPEWAVAKAITLTGVGTGWTAKDVLNTHRSFPTAIRVAEYIASKEEPPVDPDLLLARQVVAEGMSPISQGQCLAGGWDSGIAVRSAYKAIKEVRSQYV